MIQLFINIFVLWDGSIYIISIASLDVCEGWASRAGVFSQ